MADLAIELRGVTKSFGRVRVLEGIDLAVPSGSVFGWVGQNGAGKTTTIECALGAQSFDGGSATVLGTRPASVWRLRGRLAAVFDAPCLRPRLRVCDVLSHARLLCKKRAADPFEIAERLGLTEFLDRRVSRLSLGNRRRLAIARALVSRPELLVLDEPFSGLDASGVEDVLDLFIELHEGGETTLLLSSHQLQLLERVATHLAILHGGRVVREGEKDSLLAGETPQVRVTVDDVQRAETVLGETPGVVGVEKPERDALECRGENVDAAEINRRLVAAGVGVSELTTCRPSLVALFRMLTRSSESPRDDVERQTGAGHDGGGPP